MFWVLVKEENRFKMHYISYLTLYPHLTINFTLFATMIFSHLEIRIIISTNVIWYVGCKGFQKLCYDSSGIFNSYFISKVSSVPFLSDRGFELLWQNSHHQSTQGQTICALYYWKPTGENPSLVHRCGSQMWGMWNPALHCFVLN